MTLETPIKRFARLLLPPIVIKAGRRLIPAKEIALLEFAPKGWDTTLSGNGATWNQESVVGAEEKKWAAFCRNVRGTGPLGFSHEDPDLDIVRSVYFHNIHITYAYVLALAAGSGDSLSILDWGGGLGHYYEIAAATLPRVSLDFHCREVPLMCERGRKLAPAVHFHETDACLNRTYDLVMINGSLGYFRDWQEVLSRAADAAGRYLFLTRVLTVYNEATFVAVQHTDVYDYNADMLTNVFNESEIMEVVRGAGFQLVREFVVGAGPTIARAPEQSVDCGWLFERRTVDQDRKE